MTKVKTCTEVESMPAYPMSKMGNCPEPRAQGDPALTEGLLKIKGKERKKKKKKKEKKEKRKKDRREGRNVKKK
jgi:hypothetical protein